MSDKNTGGPAFPYSALTPEGPNMYADNEGMTLRDYFAAKAMHGIVGDSDTFTGAQMTATKKGRTVEQVIAKSAYELADAMIAERAK